MTDTQILTLALTLLGIFAGTLFNNSRIGDVKDVIRAEMRTMHAEINERFTRLESTIECNQETLMRIGRR